MWWGIHDGMGWWMTFAGIWMLIFWGPIIALVVWGIIRLYRDKDRSAQRKSAAENAQSEFPGSSLRRPKLLYKSWLFVTSLKERA